MSTRRALVLLLALSAGCHRRAPARPRGSVAPLAADRLAVHADGARGDLARELDGVGERVAEGARIGAALEPVARLGVEAVATRRAADAPGVEVGALEEHLGRRGRNFAIFAAHDARERHRALAVTHDEVVGRELARDALDQLARHRARRRPGTPRG